MKVASKLFGILLLLVAMSATASALVDVTYSLNTQNANAQAYNCINADCSSVSAFTGSFPNGASTEIGQLTVRFPSTLATQYGYAVFFSSNGYIPLAQKVFSHTYGDDKVFTTSVNLNLEKQIGNTAESCSAIVDSFELSSDNAGSVNADASLRLSAISTSFTQPSGTIKYIPSNLQSGYLTADTDLMLDVYDVHMNKVLSQNSTTTLTAGTTAHALFNFNIAKTDQYTLKLTTQINDAKCTSSVDSEYTKSVLLNYDSQSAPFKTEVTNFKVSPLSPGKNTQVTVSFDVASYQHWGNGVYKPLSGQYYSEVYYKLYAPNGGEVYSGGRGQPTTETFGFVPLMEGAYTLHIDAAVGGGRPDPKRGQIIAHDTYTIVVGSSKTYNASFQPFDAITGNKIVNATATLNGVSIVTNTAGAIFEGLAPGLYNYAITQNDYNAVSGSIVISDYNQVLSVPMNPKVPGTTETTHSATITVVDADGNTISGAEVTIGSKHALTNSFGQSTFIELDNGTYEFSASADGYDAKSSSFVIAGSDVNVIVSLGIGSNEASSEQELFVRSVRIPYAFEAKAGETVDIYLTFENKNLGNMRAIATAVIPELGVRASAGPFDFNSGDDLNKVLHLEIPAYAEPGTYFARIAIGEGKNTRIIYREVELS